MSFALGEIVGQYKIEGQLGHGGMATVYKGYHLTLGRHVAIKVISTALGNEKDSLERFKREARIIAKLDNPHIVPVYDFDEKEGKPYLVLKLIDGTTLRERLLSSPLSNFEILEVVLAVGDGLQYAHACGVLHRDIKPSNVLIGQDGKIYLTDFGLARIAESNTSLTGDMILGTPHYMSPEQALNEEQLDEGTDIYSFGVMMYEMVVGQLPYNSKDPFSIIEAHIKTPPPLPKSIKPGLSDEVEQVILKALAKDRSERYAKVTDLIKAFTEAWVTGVDRSTLSSTTRETVNGAVLLSKDGHVFPLSSGQIVLGRNSTTRNIYNDIDLNDLDVKKIISRRHAMVDGRDNQYVLYDLKSRNGTFLNGERIHPEAPHTLVSGDIIEFGLGGVKLTFSR